MEMSIALEEEKNVAFGQKVQTGRRRNMGPQAVYSYILNAFRQGNLYSL